MGGASKLFLLLSSPFPLLYHRRPSVLRLARHSRVSLTSYSKRRFSSNSRPRLGFSIKASEQIHTETTSSSVTAREDQYANSSSSRVLHPWPEWSNLVDNLRSNGYFNRQLSSLLHGEDAFLVFEDLPEEFVRAASACLSFARHRSDLLGLLSRKDIEIVVENGSPFMFKSAVDSARRMKSFLGNHGSNKLVFESAHTVDLMRFLLSYACNPTASEWNNFNNRELIEASIRNLLGELADASRSVEDSDISSSLPDQFPHRYGQTPRPFGQNIEMKRGDWICAKCSFMNFARNMKCLECSEARPKMQLTGGEWECPQCDFFNYGRNLVCLRCDCKRPREVSFGTADTRSALGYNNENKADIENTRDKMPLELRLTDRGNLGYNDGTTPDEKNGFRAGNEVGPTKSIGQSLDRILGQASLVSETDKEITITESNRNSISSSSSSAAQYSRQSDGSKSDYVPFVPLPADMFAKPQKSNMEEEQVLGNDDSASAKADGLMMSSSHVCSKSNDGSLFSEKTLNQKTEESSREVKEEAEKSERWFRKVAELHDVTDLASAISDEDFPEIMPLRKGENRFVVSKKKDRSLISPPYKRRMAMEQANNNTNFVPFVPFPPDYFAKKDKQTETQDVVSEKLEDERKARRFADSGASWNSMKEQPENRQISKESHHNTILFSGKSLKNERKLDFASNRRESLNGGKTWNEENSSSRSDTVSSIESSNHNNSRERDDGWKEGGFLGKSLEGSLVKEPDPLDMSEEAKAERWFRRAAQIKDISELSQIPDEDFPEIMPMRKGVNRFVVSKRKTPLERRLTSPQYRRNLPTNVSSEPPVKENNES